MNVGDLFPQEGKFQTIYCDDCGSHLDLSYTDFDDEVSRVHIAVKGLPVLRCSVCNATCFPDRSRFHLIQMHRQAMEKGLNIVRATRNKILRDFGFTCVSFIYDSDDYDYIPGLSRGFNEGFLTPVFFKKEVLLKYDAHPSYRVVFASPTYGTIRQNDDFSISFGINKYGRLVMWLGDIAQLPENEQHYLRSENVPSDHSIGSEFYDGQIECIFTDKTLENKLFEQRSRFLDICFRLSGQKIAHLEKEVLEIAIAIRRPIVDTDTERRNVADALNKIYLESLDKKALKKLLAPTVSDESNLGSLKLLQKLAENVFTSPDAAALMNPLYVLYDLRVAYSHLGSDEGQQERLASVRQRLTLASDADFFAIYDRLMPELCAAFGKLADELEQNPTLLKRG
jgi:uncharacterized protein YihD (DUF1040 family)